MFSDVVASYPEAANSLAQELNQDAISVHSGTTSDSSLGETSPVFLYRVLDSPV
jgi:hypothetical protein